MYLITLDVLLDHSKLVLEVLKLYLGQRLGQHICDLLICGDILELHSSLYHHITYILILDVDVLRLVMKRWILKQLYSTLVVTKDTSHIQLKVKKPCKQLPKPHNFATG